MAKKGSAYEREICKRLSAWWTSNESEDSIFWRTSNSGGRATTRSKKNKKTKGSHGDVGAIDPVGSLLISTFTIEIKRGYSQYTIVDILDKPLNYSDQMYDVWFKKVLEDQKQAGSPYWILISRRDRRIPLVFFPWDLTEDLEDVGCSTLRTKGRYASFYFYLTVGEKKMKQWVSCVPLERFLKCVTPEHIKSIANASLLNIRGKR